MVKIYCSKMSNPGVRQFTTDIFAFIATKQEKKIYGFTT